ncbi:hypothetical protein GCM10010452_40910 [Crossiella cryophila]
MLLKYPAIAAQVADPDRKVTVETKTRRATDADPLAAQGYVARAAGVNCWINDHWVTSYTLLGNVFYKFHQRADHCEDGSNVTSVHNRYRYLSEVDGLAYDRGDSANSVGGTPSAYVESFMQGKIENCVLKYGCLKMEYPWVKLTFRGGNGSRVESSGGIN